MKKVITVVMIAAMILVMNTIVFAETTGKLTVTANRNEYNVSAETVKKSNTYPYAYLTSISGPNTDYGLTFSVYVVSTANYSGEYYTKKMTISSQYVTTAELDYETALNPAAYYVIAAKLLGYPRYNEYVFSAYLRA